MKGRKRSPGKRTVALATLGLTTCCDNGAVDPPPPPLICHDENSTSLAVDARLFQPNIVEVFVSHTGYANAFWRENPIITDVVNLELNATALSGGQYQLRFAISSPPPEQARFTLTGTLVSGTDTVGGPCDVTQTFTLTFDGRGVEISSTELSLPLGSPKSAMIELVQRDGLRLELLARDVSNPDALRWRVSGGELDVASPERVSWVLPNEPGLYQAELTEDNGAGGLGFDTITLEVL